jgi:hypothetical protein
MIKATLPKRGQDAWGSGAFGASRGTRIHKGIDYCCYPDTVITSHILGVVTKLGYPYSDDLRFRYVEVTTPDKCRHRWFYVSPEVVKGDVITVGQPIGVSQDIAGRYRDPKRPPMTNHVHFEILDTDGTPIDPEVY